MFIESVYTLLKSASKVHQKRIKHAYGFHIVFENFMILWDFQSLHSILSTFKNFTRACHLTLHLDCDHLLHSALHSSPKQSWISFAFIVFLCSFHSWGMAGGAPECPKTPPESFTPKQPPVSPHAKSPAKPPSKRAGKAKGKAKAKSQSKPKGASKSHPKPAATLKRPAGKNKQAPLKRPASKKEEDEKDKEEVLPWEKGLGAEKDEHEDMEEEEQEALDPEVDPFEFNEEKKIGPKTTN